MKTIKNHQDAREVEDQIDSVYVTIKDPSTPHFERLEALRSLNQLIAARQYFLTSTRLKLVVNNTAAE